MTRAIEFTGGFLTLLFSWLFGGLIAAPVFLAVAGVFAAVSALCGLPAIILYYFVRTMIGA